MTTKYKFSLLLIGCLTCFNSGLYAQNARSTNIKQNDELPLDTAVRKGQLANGFTYYIRHNEEPKNRVIMYLANKVGSILEDDDQQGLAHFMEHMNFNGTTHFPKNELVDYLQKSGIRFGADLNAYTSFDETVYQLPIPSNNPELLRNGIEIMHDWAQGALLDSIEIDNERGIVLEEKRLGKGYWERMERSSLPFVLNNSRYASRLPIGIDTVLNNFKPETIRRFYKDWYRPDLQAIIIVGDIDVNAMEAVVKEKFSDLKNPVNERPRTYYKINLMNENRFLAVTDKEMPSTVTEISFKYPKDEFKTVNDYRNLVIRLLVSNMLSNRYAELAKKMSSSFINCSAYTGHLMGNVDSYTISVQTAPGKLEAGIKAAWRENIRAKQFGFNISELTRAKDAYLSGMSKLAVETGKIESQLYVGDYLDNFLNGTAASGIEYNYQLVKQFVPGITLDDINSVLTKHVIYKDRTILIQAPEKAKSSLPTAVIVDNWLKEISSEKLVPYHDEIVNTKLLNTEPVNRGSIVTQKFDKDLNMTTWKLSNGIVVNIKPTDFKTDEIMISSFSAGGKSVISDADFISVEDAAYFVSNSGLGRYNSNQFDRFLNGKVVNVIPYIDDDFQGIEAFTNRKDLKTAMEVIYGYFKEPRLDRSVYDNIMEKSRIGLIDRYADPANVFKDSLNYIMGNYNYRVSPPSLEKLNKTVYQKVLAGYRNLFSDASGFKFTFVGNIDTNILKPLVIKYLSGLPSTFRNEKINDLHIYPVQGKVIKKIYAGTESKSSVVLVFSGKFDYSQANKIKLDALKECLSIRLIQRLREKDAEVYSPSVTATIDTQPEDRYKFVIKFGCAPENVNNLIASTLDEVNELKANGPNKENVKKWFMETKTAYEPNLRENYFWLTYITNRLKNNEDLSSYSKQIKIMQEVSSSDVKQMANLYFNKNFLEVILLPKQINN